MLGSSVSPGVDVGDWISGKTSGQINKWYFPCLKQSFSSKIDMTVDPRGLRGSFFFVDDQTLIAIWLSTDRFS